MGDNSRPERSVRILVFNDNDLVACDPFGEVAIKGLLDLKAGGGVQTGLLPVRFPEGNKGRVQNNETHCKSAPKNG